MAYETVFGKLVCKCDKCGNVWVAAGDDIPKRCGKCKTPYWSQPSTASPKEFAPFVEASGEIKMEKAKSVNMMFPKDKWKVAKPRKGAK